MDVNLLALISVELGHTDALDWFLASCLCEGGIWDRPRTSDGISAIRVLERGPDTLRVAGHIWEINQSLHAFRLELERTDLADRFGWVLHFDVIETSARRARDALSNHQSAAEIEWRAKLEGDAIVIDDTLTIVAGSTRVLVQDIPQLEPVEQQLHRRGRRARRQRRPRPRGSAS